MYFRTEQFFFFEDMSNIEIIDDCCIYRKHCGNGSYIPTEVYLDFAGYFDSPEKRILLPEVLKRIFDINDEYEEHAVIVTDEEYTFELFLYRRLEDTVTYYKIFFSDSMRSLEVARFHENKYENYDGFISKLIGEITDENIQELVNKHVKIDEIVEELQEIWEI